MKEKILPDDKKATEYLANERTYLAWVRTSVAIVSLGFVVAKFSVWMRELIQRIVPNSSTPTGYSMPIGVALMVFGGLLPIFAWVHYRMTNKAIERGSVKANHAFIISVTITVFAFTIAMIVSMLLTTKNL